MSDDNTQGGAEPSLASDGSRPVAWAVVQSECWSVYLTRLDANRAATHGLGELVPLYRQPQPTLTDEEREAVAIMERVANRTENLVVGIGPRHAKSFDGPTIAATLRTLLERTK